MAARQDVVGDAQLLGGPLGHTVLRYMRNAGVPDFPDGMVGDILSIQLDRPGGQLLNAGNRLQNVVLSIALHTGQPQNLAFLYVERDIVQQLSSRVVLAGGAPDLQDNSAR